MIVVELVFLTLVGMLLTNMQTDLSLVTSATISLKSSMKWTSFCWLRMPQAWRSPRL